MSPRRACRKDANHDAIADAFRRLGWQWYDTYQFAQYVPGFPDGMAVKPGAVLLVEVKGKRGRLTDDERTFHRVYLGPIMVARTEEDVVIATQMWAKGEL